MPKADPEVGATLQKPSTQCLHQDFQLEVEGAKVGKQKDVYLLANLECFKSVVIRKIPSQVMKYLMRKKVEIKNCFEIA